MPKMLSDFIGFRVGDIIALSDLQTQTEFGKMSVDFPIKEVRKYTEPNGVFQYIGYLVDAPNDQELLIVVKTMGKDFEIYVYYLDTSAQFYKAAAGQEECPFYVLLSDDRQDLTKRIEAQVNSKSGLHPVTWDQQTVTHGVRYEDTDGAEGICTVGEYFTNDENDGNNFCLVDWKGDADKGLLEIWYGCLIKNYEVEMLHK